MTKPDASNKPARVTSLSASDYRRLHAAAQRRANHGCAIAERILTLLKHAIIRHGEELTHDLIQLDTFVKYSVDGRAPEERALVLPEDSIWPDAEISVFTSIGSELLGRRAGKRIPFRLQERPAELQIIAVGGSMPHAIIQHY